jgi:Ca2+-binding RTX toxin-like protein
MIGGTGDDIYVVDNASDVVAEKLNEGIDTVRASINYTLADTLENLTLTGTADLIGTGNSLDNVLTGNAGNSTLLGGEGNDRLIAGGASTMLGGTGDDTYVVNSDNDLVIENPGEGLDTVLSSITYALTENVEHLKLLGTFDLNGTGNGLDNVITGNVGNNMLDGGLGADTMSGGSGNDTYIVDNTGDQTIELADNGIDSVLSGSSWTLADNVENLTLTGTANLNGTGNGLDNVINGNTGNNMLDGEAGNDVLTGNGGNDFFAGGTGNDTLLGGLNSDTYRWRQGDGLDTLSDAGGNDSVQFGAGLNLDNLALRVTSLDGVYTAHVRALNASGCEMDDQGLDFNVSIGADGKYVSPIEQFYLADGTAMRFDDLLLKTVETTVRPQTRTVSTGRDDDIIYAGSTSDTIYSGTGNDIVYAFAARDTVYGEGGNDALLGGSGADTLNGGCGYNILAGGNNQDVLTAGNGNNLFLGGSGSDQLIAGAGNNLIAGGKQDDTITIGAGNNIVAFNRGDARDTLLVASGGHSALSLGGGLSCRDLSFARSGNDLVLDASRGDAITIKDWYTSSAHHSIVTLQMIEEASPDYAPASTDSMLNSKVEFFDFQKLVDSFEQASTANPGLNQWGLMNGLLDAHLNGSDSAALGGELAYEYGTMNSLAQVGVVATETTLKAPGFGTMQALKPFQGLPDDVAIGR